MKNRRGRRPPPMFPRGKAPVLPAFRTPGQELARVRREAKLRTDSVFAEREARRQFEVKRAFYEGILAARDAWFFERDPDLYWLESDSRRDLYAGPPVPVDADFRIKLAMRGRGQPGYSYDPQLDPGQVWTSTLDGRKK